MYLTVEGMDGAGKTALMLYLNDAIQEVGFSRDDFIYVREPGSTHFAEELREQLKHDYEEKNGRRMDLRTQLLAMFTARSDVMHNLVYPALERGKFVIADRGELSSFAYQVRSVDSNLFRMYAEMSRAVCPIKPTYIFLDVSFDESMKRRGLDGTRVSHDSLEAMTAGQDKFDDLRDSYFEILEGQDYVYVDTTGKEPAEVLQEAMFKVALHTKHPVLVEMARRLGISDENFRRACRA